MLGVLGIADRFQKTRVAPDAPAILGRTGPFTREADRVALPLVPRQDLFHEQLVLPTIPEIVFIKELALLTQPKRREGHRARVFGIQLTEQPRIPIPGPADDELIQVRVLPAHHGVPAVLEQKTSILYK